MILGAIQQGLKDLKVLTFNQAWASKSNG